VLVGPSGAGKTYWAEAHFRPDQIVSSDALRGLVGEGPHDQRAGKDAFDVLDLVLQRRLRRRLVTVIDTLGLDGPRRRAWIDLARRHDVPVFAVGFDTEPAECRRRNKARERRVPADVLSAQIRSWTAVREMLPDEGYDAVHPPEDVDVVPASLWHADLSAHRQRNDPMTLRFGLQIPSFTWPGGPAEIGERLRDVAAAAEEAGFSSIWVMDHFLQIPPVGPEWNEMLDSYTTLGYLAGATRSARLGVLVTGVTYRNVAHLGKIVATLDVLSGGRAICGIGAAWFEREHRAYGWEFPPLRERYALLEDALQLLPLLWGPGSPPFEGRVISVPEAICYPRPLQEPRPPIMVGGSGERRTLKLVARYADACNLFGDAATVRHKLEVLRRHCDDAGRDMGEIEITQLSTALVGTDRAELEETMSRIRPDRISPEQFAAKANAGTVDDHIGRFRDLAEAGVQTAIVNMPDLGGPEPVERFAQVIAEFS
jgi:F420-dependent oxidoreductase-like protein